MRRNNRSLLVIGLTCAFFILLLSSFVHGQQGATLRASYIDVGQGDSILLHASDNTDVLIDGGPRAAGPTVVAYLQQEGVDDIDVMVLSYRGADLRDGSGTHLKRSPIDIHLLYKV